MQTYELAKNTFEKLKQKYPTQTVVLEDTDLTLKAMRTMFKDHREYIAHKFKQLGVEVYRWNHNYNSLETNHPELGLVYLAGDSQIAQRMEIWALIGHNARYINEEVKLSPDIKL